MDIKIEILPFIALLIVIVMMTYTNLFIIGEIGRVLSLIPLILVLLVWIPAVLKLRRSSDVH